MPSDNTPTSPLRRPGKARAHLGRHKGKYTLATISATLIGALQLFGALGPLLCHLPWVADPAACEAQAARAKAAAAELGTLDGGVILQ